MSDLIGCDHPDCQATTPATGAHGWLTVDTLGVDVVTLDVAPPPWHYCTNAHAADALAAQ